MRLTRTFFMLLVIIVLAFSVSVCATEPEESKGEEESASIVIPIIMNGPDTGWVLGFLYMKQSSGPTNNIFQGGLMYSEEEQMSVFAGVDHYLSDGKYLFKSQIAYSDSPSDFFGVGNEDPDRTGEEYTSIAKLLSIGILQRIKNGLYFGPIIACNWFEVDEKTEGALLDQGNIYGSDGADAIGLGINLSLNKLDDLNSPKQGYTYDLIFLSYDEALGSSHEFSQFKANFSKFYSLKRGVIGLNTKFVWSDGDVPFQMLPSLGNSSIMRGLEPNKYCDLNFFAIQGEYRLPIYKRWNGVTFIALGDVADSVSNLNPDNYTYGFGIRYALDQNQTFKLRLDIGCGKNESAAYFGLQEAF